MFSSKCFRYILYTDAGTFATKCNPNSLQNLSLSLFANASCKRSFSFDRKTSQRILRLGRGFRSKAGDGSKPTRHKSLAPVSEVSGTAKGFGDLLKPLMFGVVVSGSSFAGAAIWQYENMRRIAIAHTYQNQLRTSIDGFYQKAGDFRRKLNAWWSTLNSGHKVAAVAVGLNTLVFMLWRTPQFRHIMVKYFTSSPMSGAVCWSMLLSAFSHYSFTHLFVNMYVLWSFSPVVTKLFCSEETVAMYITAAMVSGFASYVHKIARCSMVPSVGASGAIMALIGAVCISMPQARLSIAFVDQLVPHSFSADSAMKCLIAFDTIGVLLGWRFFDHAGHLGGILFGIWYVKYGHKMIWKKREPLMRRWHTLRGKP